MRRALAVAVVTAVSLALLGAVAYSRIAGWSFLGDRPVLLVDRDQQGNAVVAADYGYNDRLAANEAMSEAYAQGRRPPQEGRHPATKETRFFSVDTTGGGQPIESTVERIGLPGTGSPLFVRKVNLPQGVALIADPGSGTPYLHRSPDGTRYVVQVDNHLYLLHTDTLETTGLTPNSIREFKYEELLEKTLETEASLLWADQPLWSQDGRTVFYVSNRRDIAESTGLQEIWAVDLMTGTHDLIYEHPGVYLLGCHEDEVIFDDSRDIVAVSVSTSQARTVVEGGRPLGFGHGKVLTGDDYLASEQLLITDIGTGQRRSIEAPAGTTFTRGLPSLSGGAYAAVVRNSEGTHAVAVYTTGAADAVSLSLVANLPLGFTTVANLSFLDDQRLLVSLQKAESGNVVEAAYVMHLKEGD